MPSSAKGCMVFASMCSGEVTENQENIRASLRGSPASVPVFHSICICPRVFLKASAYSYSKWATSGRKIYNSDMICVMCYVFYFLMKIMTSKAKGPSSQWGANRTSASMTTFPAAVLEHIFSADAPFTCNFAQCSPANSTQISCMIIWSILTRSKP